MSMGKFFTTLLSVTAAASVAMAATPQAMTANKLSADSRYAAPNIEKLTTSQRSHVLGANAGGQCFLGKNVESHRNLFGKAPKRQAEGETPTVITETPAGLNWTYSRSGNGFMVFWGYVMPHVQSGQILNAVISNDFSTIYMQDPVSSAVAGSWVKGSFDFMNDKVTIPTGQYVMYNEEEGYGAVLAAGKLTKVEEDGDVYYTYVMDETVTEITYEVDPMTLGIKVEDKFFSTEETPEYLVSLFWSDDHSWSGYSDYNSVYTPFDEFITTLPYGAEASDWLVISKDLDSDSEAATFVKVAQQDDKMYLCGLNAEEPEACVTGTIADGKVTFPSNQYIGISNVAYLTYFVGGEYTMELIEDPEWGDYYEVADKANESIVFDYDAETQTLKAADNASMLISAGKADLGTGAVEPFSGLYAPTISYFKDVAATPATPEILDFGDYFDDYGYCGLAMNIPAVSTDGAFLNVNKLYYEIYTRTDGEEEPFVFYVDEYVGLAELGLEEMTEVPYTLEIEGFDGDDIRYGGAAVFFYSTPADAYGVKSIYKGGDEVRESPIVWYDVKGATGVKDTLTNGSATVAEIYSIDGVRRSSMARGLNIVKMSDGSVRKMIVR